jgi:hypothetical protein
VGHDGANRPIVREFPTFAAAHEYKRSLWFGGIEAPLFETSENTRGFLPAWAREQIAFRDVAASPWQAQMTAFRAANRQSGVTDQYDLGTPASTWQARLGALTSQRQASTPELKALKDSIEKDSRGLVDRIQKNLFSLTGDALDNYVHSAGYSPAMDELDNERRLIQSINDRIIEPPVTIVAGFNRGAVVRRLVGGEDGSLTFVGTDGRSVQLNKIDRDTRQLPPLPLCRYANWFDTFALSDDGRWLVGRAATRSGAETIVWDLENSRFAKLDGAPRNCEPLTGGGYRFDWLGHIVYRDAAGQMQKVRPSSLTFEPLPV